MKKNDLILIAVLLAVAGAVYVGSRFVSGTTEETAEAVVTIDGVEYGRYALAEERTERIELSDGNYNILVIRDGKADMTEASCPDKICVDHRAISHTGESIICLPHKVVVTIENGEDADLDAVAQ
jgi:hypothetical protein